MTKDEKITQEMNEHFDKFSRHTITKVKDAWGYISLKIDNENLDISSAQDISRELLCVPDLTFKYMDGIFPDCSLDQVIHFGKYEKTFRLELVIFASDIVMIREAIRKNIFTVRKWLQSCKDKARTETITLDI